MTLEPIRLKRRRMRLHKIRAHNNKRRLINLGRRVCGLAPLPLINERIVAVAQTRTLGALLLVLLLIPPGWAADDCFMHTHTGEMTDWKVFSVVETSEAYAFAKEQNGMIYFRYNGDHQIIGYAVRYAVTGVVSNNVTCEP